MGKPSLAGKHMSPGSGFERLPAHPFCFVFADGDVMSRLPDPATVLATCCWASCLDGLLGLWNCQSSNLGDAVLSQQLSSN